MTLKEFTCRTPSKKKRFQEVLRAGRMKNGMLRTEIMPGGHFQCGHCDRPVLKQPLFSGVLNRNHCPYCLHSRHLDLWEAGDRLAACKADMRPVGLTFKRRQNKYKVEQKGELMIVHQCTGCGKLSINRIAADDDVKNILGVLGLAEKLGEPLLSLMAVDGIRFLREMDQALVRRQLFGTT